MCGRPIVRVMHGADCQGVDESSSSSSPSSLPLPITGPPTTPPAETQWNYSLGPAKVWAVLSRFFAVSIPWLPAPSSKAGQGRGAAHVTANVMG